MCSHYHADPSNLLRHINTSGSLKTASERGEIPSAGNSNPQPNATAQEFNVDPEGIYPGDLTEILIENRGERMIIKSQYGLVPNWTPENGPNKGKPMRHYNARKDSIDCERPKRSFSGAFSYRRCVVGVAIIEENLGKRKWLQVVPPDGTSFLVAGLYEGPNRYCKGMSHAIITVDANSRILRACEDEGSEHERMPAILKEADVDKWLDPRTTHEELIALLQTAPNEWIGDLKIRLQLKRESQDGFNFDL